MTKHYNWVKNIDEVRQLVAESSSYAEVCRKLGRRPVGGSITHVKNYCVIHNIDISHMTGQAHNKGKTFPKLTPDNILKFNPLKEKSYRQKHCILKRALLQKGVEYKCNVCGCSTWHGEELPLEIDHINSQYWDNRIENLQFICPNCHTIKTHHDNAPVVE